MGSFLRNRKFREILQQAVVVSLVAALLVAMVMNTRASLEAQGLTTGFSFLDRSTAWDFSFSVLPYSISDTYRKTLLIGFLNTLLLGFLGIFFATLIGIIIGLIRTARNKLFRALGTLYVEIFRNVPLILQALFWYAIVSHLPKPRAAISLGDTLFLSGRGFYFPVLNIALWSVALMILIVLLWLFFLPWLRNRVQRPSSFHQIKRIGWLVLPVILFVIGYLARIPETPLVDMPALKGYACIEGAEFQGWYAYAARVVGSGNRHSALWWRLHRRGCAGWLDVGAQGADRGGLCQRTQESPYIYSYQIAIGDPSSSALLNQSICAANEGDNHWHCGRFF